MAIQCPCCFRIVRLDRELLIPGGIERCPSCETRFVVWMKPLLDGEEYSVQPPEP